MPADLGWSDVGAWSALWDLGTKDADGNVRQGDTLVRTRSAATCAAAARPSPVSASTMWWWSQRPMRYW
ncbi:hypothetical protein [Hankyongella ginsenosidimutans]|uniref:hypothetical protein n=1 Tax=Hankyongella ginsenosidimutans TaxID=1763828 RepID=UPI00319E78AB